jgi:hypothetical protein
LDAFAVAPTVTLLIKDIHFTTCGVEPRGSWRMLLRGPERLVLALVLDTKAMDMMLTPLQTIVVAVTSVPLEKVR